MSESTDRVPASLPLESGTLIAERYKLTCRIGKGGMGEVWSARHVHLGVTHAIKFIAVTLLAAGEVERTLARFEGEARATSALSRASRHIVFVSDYGVHDGIPYLVMEHLEGEPLDALLTREQRLSPQRTLDILEQICRALTQAHKANLIHRDLKPANIFIGKDETGELLVKVLDLVSAARPHKPIII